VDATETTLLAALLPALHVLLVAVVALRIFSRRSTSGAAVAWLLLAIVIPAFGALAYLLVGERRLGLLWMRRAATLRPQFLRWFANLPDNCLSSLGSFSDDARSLARLANGAVGLPAMAGHRLRLLSDSDAIMRAMIADIDAAQHSVRLEFYIWNPGGFVDDLVAALLRAASRGVACTALMDSLGSRPFLRDPAIEQLRGAGIEVIEVLPVNPLRILFVRFDLRDHRKIAVIDRRIAYTGSMNIADPRLFKQDAGVGQWVDAMVRIEGSAAWGLEAVSLSLTSLQTGSPFAPAAPPELPTLGEAAVQIVPSGPQAARIRIDAILLAAVYAARREIVLTTPYFVPGEALLTALRSAALRGVRVTLIVPQRIDSSLVRLASDSYNGDLLAAGVEIRRFRDGLLHTKSIVVDEEITLFGTVNLDIRSFELNFEVSLIVYDRRFSAEVRALQRAYEERSTPLLADEWRARPRLRRLLENAVQTMSPLL
jgi:cardiolipin synthase